jgi:hypothetical protein
VTSATVSHGRLHIKRKEPLPKFAELNPRSRTLQCNPPQEDGSAAGGAIAAAGPQQLVSTHSQASPMKLTECTRDHPGDHDNSRVALTANTRAASPYQSSDADVVDSSLAEDEICVEPRDAAPTLLLNVDAVPERLVMNEDDAVFLAHHNIDPENGILMNGTEPNSSNNVPTHGGMLHE